MAYGHLMLKQNDFPSTYVGSFKQLREAGELLDVTLACEDETVDAHKIVLAASSPFFRYILSKAKQTHPLIYLKGILFKDLFSLLDYIYRGETKVPAEDLNRFIEAAEELKITGLTEERMPENTNKLETINEDIKHDTLNTAEASVKIFDDQRSNLIDKFGEAGLCLWKCKVCGKLDKDWNIMNKHIEYHQENEDCEGPFKEESVEMVDELLIEDFVDTTLKVPNEDDNETEQHKKWRREISKRLKEVFDPIQGKMWKCTDCEQIRKLKFKTISHIETHVKHLKLVTFKCTFCERLCKTRESLHAHVSKKHKEEKKMRMESQEIE